jgi:hypothetical protein
MMQRDTSVLQLVTNTGYTSLHFACQSTLPDETLVYMANRWPVSCLSLPPSAAYLCPMTLLSINSGRLQIIDAIASTTNQAACAMIECALFRARGTIPSVVIDHLGQGLVTSILDMSLDTLRDSNTSSLALIGTVRPHLEPELIKNLVRNDALREWVKEDHVQRLICGIVRMNRFGRDYVVQTSRNDEEKGVQVLESAYFNVDCVLPHFRESPCLLEKPTSRKRKRPST